MPQGTYSSVLGLTEPLPCGVMARDSTGGTSRCPRPSVAFPSEQYLWARGSAPKMGDIRSKCSHKERRLD